MPPRKILLDMDPGIDDTLAILLALRSPELHILGLTAVAGNAPLEMTARNALRILEAAGALDIPVAAGAARPLAPSTHRGWAGRKGAYATRNRCARLVIEDASWPP
mgnify:CR=1 FL=1